MSEFKDKIKQLAPNAHIYLPRGGGCASLEEALAKTTHLLIVAHPDDDALIGGHALLQCHANDRNHMTVVVVEDGGGKDRDSAVRRKEQIKAANTGKYACVIQLGFPADDVRGMENGRERAAGKIRSALHTIMNASPNMKNLYLHSLFDAHEVHLATALLALQAVRMQPQKRRPRECYGVEVSSGLGWVPPPFMKVLPMHRDTVHLVKKILKCYPSELYRRDYIGGFTGRTVSRTVFNRVTQAEHRTDPTLGQYTGNPELYALNYSPIVYGAETEKVGHLAKQLMETICESFKKDRVDYQPLLAYDGPAGRNVAIKRVVEVKPPEQEKRQR